MSVDLGVAVAFPSLKIDLIYQAYGPSKVEPNCLATFLQRLLKLFHFIRNSIKCQSRCHLRKEIEISTSNVICATILASPNRRWVPTKTNWDQESVFGTLSNRWMVKILQANWNVSDSRMMQLKDTRIPNLRISMLLKICRPNWFQSSLAKSSWTTSTKNTCRLVACMTQILIRSNSLRYIQIICYQLNQRYFVGREKRRFPFRIECNHIFTYQRSKHCVELNSSVHQNELRRIQS